MVLLSLLAFSTVFGNPSVETSINFVILEGREIAARTIPGLGTFFLAMAGVMLFGTQFSVLGSNARIASENLVLTNQAKFKVSALPKFFYIFLWIQVLAGIAIFASGFTEPLTLVVTGAVLNAFSMFIYTGLVLYMNKTVLHRKLRPSLFRTFAVFSAFLFYGAFSVFTVLQRLSIF
jgi:hypothetical protein